MATAADEGAEEDGPRAAGAEEDDPRAAGWLSTPASALPGLVQATALQVMMVQSLDLDKSFMEAGMDSIESVDFRNQLERNLPGISLPGALVIEYPNVRVLAAYLAQAREEISPASDGALHEAGGPRAPALLDPELQDQAGNVWLPPDFPEPAPAREARGGAVLLTGATGFLGVHLLAELLEATKADRHPPRLLVVIRAASAHTGGQRVKSSLAEHGLSLGQAEWDRLRVLPTQDLSLPRLGLGESGFQELRRPELGLHTIIHNAAQVNWFRGYEQLKSTNVATTLELLQLAAELGAKFGYVSSISTLPLSNLELAIDEGCDNSWASVGVLKMSGYSQTKWVSEQLCRAACHRGVAVSIFRMPFITGHSRTGCVNLQDTPARMMQAVVQLREAPVSVQLDCVAVDVVARVTARVSLRSGTCGVDPGTGQLVKDLPSCCVVHIATKFGKLGMERVFEQLRRCGYAPLRWVSRSEWVQKAMQQRTAAAPIQVFDRLFNRPSLLNSMGVEALEALDVRLRDVMEVTGEQLRAMLRFLQAAGALPQPSPSQSLGGVGLANVSAAPPALQRAISDLGGQGRPPLDYEACKQSCLEEPERYHGAVAGRNLHWYHAGHNAWLTWKPLHGGQAEDRLGWVFPGGWRGFAVGAGGAAAESESRAEAEADAQWLPWTAVLDDSEAPFYRWFVGAQTNAALNEVDRHLADGFGPEIAHIVDLARPAGGRPEEERITRRQLLVESATAAAVLAREPLRLRQGDRALLFLPTTVEQLVWTEACKRLGVIYSACTPGLASGVLADRLCELEPAVLITVQNSKDPRWGASVASAVGDFARVSWILEALQAVAMELHERSLRRGCAEGAPPPPGVEVAAAVMEAHASLQEAFGASRCANLSAALGQAKKEVGDRLREGSAEDGWIAQVLSRMEEAVKSTCKERAKGKELQVLLLDAEAASDASPAVDGASEGGAAFGTNYLAASQLRAAALAAGGGALRGAVEESAEASDQELLAGLWREAGRPVPVEANFPLFVCYTSGSSAKPHGVVHCHGYEAGLVETLRWVFDAEPGKDRMLAISHPGWIVGQSYIYAAPLCARITSIAMEGSPIRPSHMRFAEVIQRHQITILKTGSTFLREVMSYPKAVSALCSSFDFSCVKVATFCSEPLSPQVQAFAMQHLCPQYVNSYWSTEHGGITWTRCWGCQDQLLIANTHAWPLPWISAEVLSLGAEEAVEGAGGREGKGGGGGPEELARAMHPGECGDVAIVRPYPYQFRCIWGDPARVLEKGWRGDAETTVRRYWHHVRSDGSGPRWAFVQRDWAQKHQSGAFTFHGRSDEVMNLCGITVGTETIESAVLRDKYLQPDSPIGDCAVVGHPHVVWGEMPLAFVTLTAPGASLREADRRRLAALVFEAVGNVGLEFVQVPELPRTMTGKILRSILHALIRDDRDAFLRASRAVQNPHCLRNLQQQLHEWRRLHSHFTSASGPLAKDAARVASASQLFEDDSAFGRSPLDSEQEEESPPGKEGLRRNGGGEQEASRRHAGQRARPPETEAGAMDAACTSQGATCSSGSRAASPEAGTRQGPPAGAASAGSAGARRRRTRSRLRLEEEEEESDEEEEDASEVGEPPRRRRGQRRRPRPRQPEPWEVTLDLRFLAAFGAGAALMAALAAAQGWRRRTLGE